ncbi:MAG: PspA/IM30 family protein [Aggregatilineales bacterium]
MSDLIDKLNTLIRAKVNSSLGGSGAGAGDRDDNRHSPISDREIDAQLGTLRQQIDVALNAEDGMQKRLDDANAQIDALDRQVDAALLDGNDTQARTLTQQLQRQRQQAATLAADLEDHRRATSSLIEQVNELEALVSDARARDTMNQGEPLPSEKVLADQPPVQAESQAVPVSIRVPINRPAPPPNPATPAKPANSPPSAAPPASSTDTDDELARRRARLSGPDKS